MKNTNRFLFFILIFLMTPKLFARPEADAPVELQWEEQIGAAEYILELQNEKGIVLKTIKSRTPIFKFRMRTGQYRIRSQVTSASGQLSPWSELTSITVSLPAPSLKSSQHEHQSKLTPNPETMKAHAAIDWSKIENADHYKVELINKAGKKVEEKIVTEEKAEFDLPTGEYHYRVQTVTADGIESDFVESKSPIVVSPSQTSKPKIEQKPGEPIKWLAPSQSTVFGKLEYSPHLIEEWTAVIEKQEMKGSTFSSKDLKPGRYRLQLWTAAPGWIDSEHVSAEFVVKPQEKDIHFDSY